jgi:predicted acylesterase/phospholipase RssA
MLKFGSFEGGGTYLQGILEMLVYAKKERGIDIVENLNVIGGVSAGCLGVACLGMGWDVEKCLSVFNKYRSKMFVRNKYMWMSKEAWLFANNRAFYKISEAEKTLKKIFSIDGRPLLWCELQKECYALTTKIYAPENKYADSYEVVTPDSKIPVYKVCAASMAAPVYFSPYVIHGREYIDGGVSDNNIMNTMLNYYPGQRKAGISFVTGGVTPASSYKRAGAVKKAKMLVSALISCNSAGEREKASQRLQERYMEFKPYYKEEWGLDTLNKKHLAEMGKVCCGEFDLKEKEFKRWFAEAIR